MCFDNHYHLIRHSSSHHQAPHWRGHQISREVPSNIRYYNEKKKSFNNFSKYKKRYHLINTEYINFPKEEKDSERRSNTLPFNLSKKKYIAPYIVTTNLTYVCNIFATEKHPLPGNYSNLLHLEIKMPKRCDNIILPPASSWLLFQLWEEDVSKKSVRQQRSLEQFHTLSINHIKK